jgi:hypothetical protein
MRFLVLILLLSEPAFSESCVDWFKRSGAEAGSKNCELKCSSHMTDMGTFDCPSQCETLCKVKSEPAQRDSKYLRGITEGDKKAALKYPKDAVFVYEAKQKADRLTDQVFGKAGRNDESDAFRHFVWASLLTQKLGEEKARFFLEAHEQEPLQPKPEFEMDTANNNAGVDFVKGLNTNDQSLELDRIEKEALTRLKENKLKVLNPSKKKLPDGYYSK